MGKESTKGLGVQCTFIFAQWPESAVDWCTVARVTIDTLPDVALLGIFEFYVALGDRIEAWHTLVHVCRNWRIVVFGSPRRLNLRLLCTARTSIRKLLDVWPPLPIVVRSDGDGHEKWGVENIFAALKHNDRICQLELIDFPVSQAEKVLAAMQKPFPALKGLFLRPNERAAPIDFDLFLGGSAPRIQSLRLHYILPPGLPDVLLSATHLVDLDLWFIPHSDCILPETMVHCLSGLTRLERLDILVVPESLRDLKSRHPSFPTRILLPVLTRLWIRGTGEYLEDLVAQIDAPLLDYLTVSLFQEPFFNTPELIQFINRAPKFKPHNQACVAFDPGSDAWVNLPQASGGRLRVETACGVPDHIPYLAQICNSTVPGVFISAVEHLYIMERLIEHLDGDIERNPAQWLELLHPFTAVKRLYISETYTPHVAFALQELVVESVTDVLPTLQTLFFETYPQGPAWEAIGQFVVARQLVGQPVTLSHWDDVCDVWDEVYEMGG